MKAKIHPTAIISPEAQLADGVEVGAFAIVGPHCVVGEGCVIAPRASLERYVTLGANVKVGSSSILGGDPQDLKYKGEPTTVEIGENTVIREFATINRGTTESMKTTVGKNCFIMTYVHLAHDCHVGDNVIISNGSQFAGHITIEERCIISGHSRVPKDVPPYLKAVGNPIKLYGLNSVGLQRNNFSPDVVHELKRAYRLFFRSELNVTQAMERAEHELQMYPEVKHFLEFVGASGRGVVM
jgi:UDP-N-acetylglucosamine acyltransferase